MNKIQTLKLGLFIIGTSIVLSSCCKYQELTPLKLCFNKNQHSFVTKATVITQHQNNWSDTLEYSFGNTSTCLSIRTEDLVDSEVVSIATDTPYTYTLLTDFEKTAGGCGAVHKYMFSVNGVSRGSREQHAVTIDL